MLKRMVRGACFVGAFILVIVPGSCLYGFCLFFPGTAICHHSPPGAV